MWVPHSLCVRISKGPYVMLVGGFGFGSQLSCSTAQPHFIVARAPRGLGWCLLQQMAGSGARECRAGKRRAVPLARESCVNFMAW